MIRESIIMPFTAPKSSQGATSCFHGRVYFNVLYHSDEK